MLHLRTGTSKPHYQNCGRIKNWARRHLHGHLNFDPLPILIGEPDGPVFAGKSISEPNRAVLAPGGLGVPLSIENWCQTPKTVAELDSVG